MEKIKIGKNFAVIFLMMSSLISLNINKIIARPGVFDLDNYNEKDYGDSTYKEKLAFEEKELHEMQDELKLKNIKEIIRLHDFASAELLDNFEKEFEETLNYIFHEQILPYFVDPRDHLLRSKIESVFLDSVPKIKKLARELLQDVLGALASKEFNKEMEEFYSKNFNYQEIEDILRFMKSKAGKKLLLKTPELAFSQVAAIAKLIKPLFMKYREKALILQGEVLEKLRKPEPKELKFEDID